MSVHIRSRARNRNLYGNCIYSSHLQKFLGGFVSESPGPHDKLAMYVGHFSGMTSS